MNVAATPAEHPERTLVRRVIDEGARDVAVETNPLAIALGMRLLTAGEGSVRLAFTVGAGFTQGNGVVQGGIISALLDFGMVFAAFSSVPPGATVATVSQTTNYFRPAPAGALWVEAELEKAGRTMINARATLLDTEGRLLASATAPIAVIPLR